MENLHDRIKSLNQFKDLFDKYREMSRNLETAFPYYFEGGYGESVEKLLDFLSNKYAETIDIPAESFFTYMFEENLEECIEGLLNDFNSIEKENSPLFYCSCPRFSARTLQTHSGNPQTVCKNCGRLPPENLKGQYAILSYIQDKLLKAAYSPEKWEELSTKDELKQEIQRILEAY